MKAAATAHMEADRWPDPLCGSLNVHKMGGKTQAGMFLCNDCRDKFTVRTGTVFERSHIPLHKWLLATHLMAASKKSVSALQLQRDNPSQDHSVSHFNFGPRRPHKIEACEGSLRLSAHSSANLPPKHVSASSAFINWSSAPAWSPELRAASLSLNLALAPAPIVHCSRYCGHSARWRFGYPVQAIRKSANELSRDMN
jgi:hypothetical protein